MRGCPWRSRPERMTGVESTPTRLIYTITRDAILATLLTARDLRQAGPDFRASTPEMTAFGLPAMR